MIDAETITYKQTGLDWMPVIPENWETRRAKAIFQERSIKGFPDEPLLAASQKQGVVLKEMLEQRSMEAVQNFESFKLVEKDDFVISLRSFEGGIELAYYRGIISPVYSIFYFRENRHNRDFFKYLFKSRMFIQELNVYKKGIRDGQSISYSEFANIYLPVPSKDEQDEIVQYIKAQEEKINLFIQKKQRFIELLKEQRLSIVFKTVTKGINKDVPFKETNIDWIGKVPSHWELKRMKYLCKISNGMDCEKEDVGEFPVYGSGGIFGWTNKSLYDMPSVLLGRKGTIDKPIFVTEPFWTVDTAFYTRIFEEVVEPSFFYQICCCIPFESLSTKTALPSMTQTALYQVKMPIPPIEEQRQIVAHIKTETATIDTAIAKAEREIELIREYKEAMISEAVMGEIL